MQICGEHGDDIAYSGNNYDKCPACEEIEDLKSNHKNEIDQLKLDHTDEIDSATEQLSILEGRIGAYEDEGIKI